uniref:AIPR protein n=1 Tax=Candidatus Kentrum sp. MB TaxID=2138164 RepID=A0A450XQZ3_9GAMM|nr:MAG: AIPR protein [Candidatus Kentron sp. MB]VFK31693.1 MAG: AIPR protein [Candidatus Kentron sp. MB]VFK75614.1 MAG: AIPR protein [Candidatus Kentron sp. MB]
MNISASIIDQRLTSLTDTIRKQAAEELGITGEKLKSLAFVYLCVRTVLDLEDAEAFDCLTEGSQDFGVDALHVSEEYDGEFTVTLFQGKYKKDLEGNTNFPENGVRALIEAIRYLFDPDAKLQQINPRLRVRVEEVRSLIRDGYLPTVRALACNNGLRWNQAAEEAIARTGFGNQVIWRHVNHEHLVKIMQASKPISDTLRLTGKILTEDMDFSRVLVGRISADEIAALVERYGERLLDRNIRRYLGLRGNRVNEGIRDTLQSDQQNNFYFFNNGITLICDKFSYNGLQGSDHQVRVEGLQIINGGQTCMTIFETLGNRQLDLFADNDEKAYVLVRLYQLPSNNKDLVNRITDATNSQNPVDLRDLRANDKRQQKLENDIRALGFQYRRKRTHKGTSATDITSGAAAEAVLAVWRKRPHQAKFFTRGHFGKLYREIFTEQLNGTQIVLAVLLYRIAENRRKRPAPDAPEFIRYASCFIAMQMGRRLLRDMGLPIEKIDHRCFTKARQHIEEKGNRYFADSVQDIEQALAALYGGQKPSLQQLSATFRRGDLTEKLPAV